MEKVVKLLFLIYTLTMVILSFLPSNPTVANSDKLTHYFAFLVWAVFYRFSFKAGYWNIFFSSILLGVFIEIVQYFLPYRSGEYGDFVADLFGALCGMFLYFFTEYGIKIKKTGSKI